MVPAAEVRVAGLVDTPPPTRASETFIGQCPTIEIVIEGVRLSGLLDTGSQVTLMAESVFNAHFTETKLGKTPTLFQLRAANGLEIPYIGYAILDLEVEGIKVPGRGVVIVEDEKCTNSLIVGMNVIMACWDTLFKCSRKSAVPQVFREQKVWRDAFATCRHIEVAPADDGLIGYVRPASKHNITVPAKSELLIWGRTKMGPGGTNYCALVEGMSNANLGEVGIAKALVEVSQGRVPVRVCNPHPYSVSIGRFEKLGTLHYIQDADVHGSNDLALSLEEDGVIQVALTNAANAEERTELPRELSVLGDRSDLSSSQQEELRAMLKKWERVFAQDEEDFGRTNLVQHRIPTGDAAPIRERYRPIPPMLYKEMKTLLSSML